MKHKWYLPVYLLWHNIWYAIPRFIYKKNLRKRVDLGYVCTPEGMVPLEPFCKMIFEYQDGEQVSWKWWKKIKFI